MMLNFELSVVNHLTNSLRIQYGCRRLHSNGSEDRIISCESCLALLLMREEPSHHRQDLNLCMTVSCFNYVDDI